MILAAGYGTRLRPLTDTVPKPLLPIAGQPLLVWQLRLLREHGITDVMINLHHLGHLIEQAIGDGSPWGLRVHYSYEPEILGTGGGIKQAEEFFGSEPFVVLNGDILCNLALTALLSWHRMRGALATMVLREDPNVWTWGAVEVHDGRIVTIAGRGVTDPPPSEQQCKPYMFAGIHVMDARLLRHCPRGQYSSILDAYVAELKRGSFIAGYLMTGYWQDIGTPERYAQAQRDVEHGLLTGYHMTRGST